MDKLSIIDFGEQLLAAGDLDPVYPILKQYPFNPYLQQRAIVAYALFYDIGAAIYLAEQPDFWDAVRIAAENTTLSPAGTRWPRSSERRHFRGKKSVDAVDELARHYPNPEDLLDYIFDAGGPLNEVMDRVRTLPQFGPWIAFKLADIGERVLGIPITFPNDLGLLYDSPRKALEDLSSTVVASPEEIWDVLVKYFARFQAPPGNDRPCGPQEVETILCKYGSYLSGHYYVGKDVHEVLESLKRFKY
jgi:hypothetical protein